jgi:hypothetical protein
MIRLMNYCRRLSSNHLKSHKQKRNVGAIQPVPRSRLMPQLKER